MPSSKEVVTDKVTLFSLNRFILLSKKYAVPAELIAAIERSTDPAERDLLCGETVKYFCSACMNLTIDREDKEDLNTIINAQGISFF